MLGRVTSFSEVTRRGVRYFQRSTRALSVASDNDNMSNSGARPPRRKKFNIATTLASFKGNQEDQNGAVTVPIYQTSTFDCRSQANYDYSRSGNPTRSALEDLCRKIEHAHSAYAFTSGMAALSSVVSTLKPGEHVVACADIYGGMHRLLNDAIKTRGITVHFVPTWKLDSVRDCFKSYPDRIKHVYLESPTNPQMRVTDIRGVAKICKDNGALLCVDNSVMSPVLMTPLDLGADVVMHSATKFLAGHSDVMAGIVAVKDVDVAKQIAFVQNAHGTGLSPFDCFLVLRGMKTMFLRVKAAQDNAIQVARFLAAHPNVKRVNYLDPNEVNTEESKTHFSQAKGGGSVLSFETGNVEMSRRIVHESKIFKNTVSFGSTSSLIELPGDMSHASIPEGMRTMPADLIRLAIGIEDITDILEDLSSSIAAAAAATLSDNESRPRSPSGRLIPKRENTLSSLPLGVTLPPRDEHAVGVSMPRWEDVVAYEEGCELTHSQLAGGYPRFVFLSNVKKLFSRAEELFCGPGESAMAVPSARVALRLQQFLLRAGVLDTKVHDMYALGVFAVTYPTEHAGTAKLFWQHTGEIVSSRHASAVLEVVDRTCYENAKGVAEEPLEKPKSLRQDEDDGVPTAPAPSMASASRDALRHRIANLLETDDSNVFLYPTGMASITAAHRLLKLSSQWEDAPLPTVVWGFPYLDTLKVCQVAGRCFFFGRGDDADFAGLEELLEREAISGIFCEFPSNPLLLAPDLVRLRALADRHNVPIVCDDTIAGFTNVNLLGPNGVDILCSSLTKQFSGSGNVMGGSLVLNPNRRYFNKLRSRLVRDYEDLLWEEDARVLLQQSWDLNSRCARSNETTEMVVSYLNEHPLVDTVYYPSLNHPERYEHWHRDAEGAGYGALFSVVFKDIRNSQVFYNSLDVAKGPGFGTNFTLSCPYTMIAHYTELEWASEFGVDASLVRVWIGQEDPEQVLNKFKVALDAVANEQ